MTRKQSTTQPSRLPRGITALVLIVVLIAAGLATASLRLPELQGIVAIALLGLLSPVALIVGARATRRHHRRRIESLETVITAERAARQRQTDGQTGFLDEVSTSLGNIQDLAQRVAGSGFSTVTEAETLFNLLASDAAEAQRTADIMATAAHIDSGTYRPRLSIVNLDRHVVQTVESMGRPSLRVSFDVQPSSVWADPAAMRLVLLSTLHTAADSGASRARIGVEERNGLGILSIVDDREDQTGRGPAPERLLGSGASLSREIVPALVEHQGGTMSEGLTLDWYSTTVRLPIATPAQLASAPHRGLVDRIV